MVLPWVFIFIPFAGTLAGSVVKTAVAFQTRSLGALGWQVGALTSGFMFARALSAPLFGYLTDRLQSGSSRRAFFQRLFILVGLLLFALTSIVFPLTPFIWMLILLRTLQGVCAGILWPTMQTYVAESAGPHSSAKWLALYFTSGELGLSLGYLLYGTFFTDSFSGAMGAAVLFFLLTAWSTRYLPSRYGETKVCSSPAPANSSTCTSTWLYLSAFTAGLGVGLTGELLLIYLKESQAFTVSQTTYLLFVAGVVGQGVSLYLSHLADQGNAEAGLHRSLLLAGFGAFLLSVRGGLYSAFPALLFLYSGLYSFSPISRAYATRGFKNPATVIGFLNTAGNLGGFFSPLLGGYLYDIFLYKPSGMFSPSAVPYLLLAILLIILGILRLPIPLQNKEKKNHL